MALTFDEIGYWTELKIEIIGKYAAAYSRILSAQPKLSHVYVDAFAGMGRHKRKGTGESVEGSPVVARRVRPEFDEYHFIDLAAGKIEHLRDLLGEEPKVFLYNEDCNVTLVDEIFPRIRYEDFRRGLCLLDPYGLHLDWRVFEAAGRSKTIEIFVNFPTADINRNVLRHDISKVSPTHAARLTRWWGSEDWKQVAYTTERDLFGEIERTEPIEMIKAFQARLGDGAGFQFVPDPIPMRNTQGAIVYYLYFAGPNETGNNIARQIFKKYGMRGRV